MKATSKLTVILFILSLMASANQAVAQADYIHNRWSVQLGHSKYLDLGKSLFNKWFAMSDYRLAVNYGINSHIEVGIYSGMAKTLNFALLDTAYKGPYSYSNSPSYGIQAQYQLLPYLVSGDDFRFDLYAKGSFGFRHTKNRITPQNNGVFPEYGIGAGGAFYLLKNVGIYADYTFGRFNTIKNNLQRRSFRYGIVVKF